VVATPLGNLGDITLRALEILKSVDGVLAEDTRHSRPLLTHFGINTPLSCFFEWTRQSRLEGIIDRLTQGQNLALITDAGTPGISDPGARLVQRAHEVGVSVIPIPGASAPFCALSVAGFPTDPFHFWGFLPVKNGKRSKLYEMMLNLEGTHGWFESPHKWKKRLAEWMEHFDDRYIFVGREMTKKFETYTRGRLAEVGPQLLKIEPRGEYTVLMTSHLL
jgi:16S rRNA (cytidine1402-2'-O)-methyltransferase